MLSEEQVQKALHANRVVPLAVPNPHGPLGMEHVARVIAQLQRGNGTHENQVLPPLEVPLETWRKLEEFAEAASRTAARQISVSELAAAILQQYVTSNS